ncbi:MAG: hypothetical protein HW390_3228 [Candidatus Brocadiaceae bacterium]|nr:hypothetical protein [Candidatus Brocadiaceae bacterium]
MAYSPTDKSVGYFHLSLRDKMCICKNLEMHPLRNEKADKLNLTVLATQPQRGDLFVKMESKRHKSSVGATCV